MVIYEYNIRQVLHDEFLNNKDFISDPDTILVNELDVCFGTARIDVAVINGKMHGFEIKSEQDNLERLPAQIEAYNKIFDTLTVVVSEKHVSNVIKMIPEWWGIYCVSKEKDSLILKKIHLPQINNEVSTFYLSQLLWKNELLELLHKFGIKKGTKSKSRFALCEMVAGNINEEEVKKFVREKLKSRNWKAVKLRQLYDDLHL
jgi:hypothetical protein